MISDATKKRLTALIDPEYERQRNALHPEAEKYADKKFDRKSGQWCRCFLETVDRLWRERHSKGGGKNGTEDRIRTT